MSKKSKNVTHIPLIDWQSFFLTLALVVVVGIAMVLIYRFGWEKNVVGGIISLAMALFFCMLIIDLGYLLTSCITLEGGAINAGKDDQGNMMIFHADKVIRIEVRDLACHPIPEDKKVYRRVNLTFVMESGRAHERKVNRLTAKQLSKIREAVSAEAIR